MNDSQRHFVEELVPQIDHTAFKVWAKGGYRGELDEIRSAAYEGACSAATRADIADPRSVAYVCKRAWGAAKDERRRVAGRRRTDGEYILPPMANRRHLELNSHLVDVVSMMMDRTPEDSTIPESMLLSLSQNQKFVVRGYYELGQTQDEIAEELGLTGGRVCQILKQSLGIMRLEVRNEGHYRRASSDQGMGRWRGAGG